MLWRFIKKKRIQRTDSTSLTMFYYDSNIEPTIWCCWVGKHQSIDDIERCYRAMLSSDDMEQCCEARTCFIIHIHVHKITYSNIFNLVNLNSLVVA